MAKKTEPNNAAQLSVADRRKKSLLQFVVLIVAVVLVVLASVAFQRWWNNRPDPDPQEVTITATVGGKSTAVEPYLVCEIGETCPESPDVVTVKTEADSGADHITLKLPKNVFDHDWSLVSIYDDPARNQQRNFAAYESTSVDVPLTVAAEEGGDSASLVVVEISSALIGQNGDGEETPYAVTWSVHVKH